MTALFFAGDEAAMLDVSGAEPEELITRISNYYGKAVSMADLQQPFSATGRASAWEKFCYNRRL
jgi:hypothetical protein